MSFLVDTDVLSESTKRSPDQRVKVWLAGHESELYVSAISIGEIQFGIEKLTKSKRRKALQEWMTQCCRIMEGRILSFNPAVAHVWGRMRANLFASGIILPLIDGQIAATAVRYGLTVVTRNQKDFIRSGVKTLDPWHNQ